MSQAPAPVPCCYPPLTQHMRPPTGRAGISAKPGRPLFILLETLPSPQTDNRFCPIICTTWSCPVLAVICSRSLNLAAPTPTPAALASFRPNNEATETRTTTQASQAFSCCCGSFPLFLLLHLFFPSRMLSIAVLSQMKPGWPVLDRKV